MVWVMQQQQQANAALLERIITLIPQPASVEQPTVINSQRVHLQVKLTLDSKDGPPAASQWVSVSKQRELGDGADVTNPLTFTADATGLVDCGLTQPGRFEAVVQSRTSETVRVLFTISSVGNHIEQIVIPSQVPEMTNVEIHCGEVPEIHKENQLGLVMRLRPRGTRMFEGRSWAPQGRWPGIDMPLVLVGGNETMTCVEPEGTSNTSPGANLWNVPIDEVIMHSNWEPKAEWLLPAGEYSVQFGLANLGDKNDVRWLNLDGTGRTLTSVWLRATTFVRAEPGTLNQWKIEVPDHVRMCLRDHSKIPEVIDHSSISVPMGGMGGAGGVGLF
jgi:hypothetical protein